MPATQTYAIVLHPDRVKQIAAEAERRRTEERNELLRRRAAEAEARENALNAKRFKPNESPSPFQFFLQNLLGRHGRSTATNAGHAHWFTFPIQETLASGLWIIMLKTAQKIGLPLHTKAHVVEDIAPRVDRMINVGMLIAYGDGVTAAEVFEETVVKPVLQAAEALPHAQAVSMQDVLQLPTAQFFASLIREATTHRKHLLVAIGMLRAGNVHPSGLRVLDTIAVETAEIYAKRLRLEDQETEWEADWEQVAHELELLKQNIQVQRTLLKMPARQTTTQVRMATESATPLTIQTFWLNTELLLAAANLPNRGFIDAIGEYRKCVKSIRRLSEETVANRFFKRLAASGVGLTADERQVLEEIVVTRIASLKNWPERFPLEDLQGPALLYRLDLKDPRLDSRLALALALNRVNSDVEPESQESMGRFWASKVEWSKLKTASIEAMISNRVVPADEIARGIKLMPHKERKRALKLLMDSFDTRIDSKTLGTLTREGLVKITPIFIKNHLQRLPRQVVAKALPDVIRRSRDKDDPYDKRLDLERLILRMVNRLSAHQAREILNEPGLRESMLSIMEEAYWDAPARIKHRITDKMFRKFLDKIGDDLWRRYVLAVEISLRQSTYPSTAKEVVKEELFHPPWEDMEDDEDHWFKPSEFMGIFPDQARTLIRTRYTEDKIFLWLHEGHDTPRKLLADYHRDRQRYFEMIAGIPPSQRTVH